MPGPNTLTYIVSPAISYNTFIWVHKRLTRPLKIPAEIFPTRFRATCHGISAACGKIGAIIILLITEKALRSGDAKALGQLLAAFSVPLALGALFAWVWIPELQLAPTDLARALHLPRLPNKSLERLAKGWKYANGTEPGHDSQTGWPRGENQRLGFRKKLSDLWGRITKGGQRKELGESSQERLPVESMRYVDPVGDTRTKAWVEGSDQRDE